MKAHFEICLDEEQNLEAFDSGLKSLLIELGGGTFQKSQGLTSNDTNYDYECVGNNARQIMNSVGTLAARHRLIENMHRHTLLSGSQLEDH
jgi:hypothetical protein